MNWQEFSNIISNIFSNSLVASLLGVIVGGLVTYYAQKHSIEKQQQFERQKIINEEHKKNKELKIKAYNKIFYLNSTHTISEYYHQTGDIVLYNDKFIEYIRPIMYEVYHLLDEAVAKEFDYIETVLEGIIIIGEEDEEKWVLGVTYSRMMENIRKEFENIRNNR